MAVGLMLLGLALAACTSLPGAAGPTPDPDAWLVVGRPVKVPLALPARWTAPLGASPDEPGTPPSTWVAEALCRGDADVRQQLMSKADDGWSDAVRGCDRPEHCAWVRGVVRDPATSPDGRELAVHLLEACQTDEDAAAVEDPVVPDLLMLQWQTFAWQWRGWSPRLADALQQAVRDADAEAGSEQATEYADHAADLARTVARRDPARAAPALLGAWKSARHPAVKDAIVPALSYLADPRARAIVDEACARLYKPPADDGTFDPASVRFAECGWPDRGLAQVVPDADVDLDGYVRHWQGDAWSLAQAHPERSPAIEDALARCVTEMTNQQQGGWIAQRCLRDLAALDRSRAVAVAGKATGGDLRDDLIRWPVADVLADHLADLGLLPAGPPIEGRPPVTAVDLLKARHVAVTPDVGDEDAWPPPWEHVAYQLADLDGASLADVRFESLAPTWDDQGKVVGRRDTVVYAWADGERWRIDVPATSYVDVYPLVGLLNALEDERGRDVRYAVLQDGDVVLGPKDGLEKASADGTLKLAPPPTPAAETDTDAG